MKLEAGKLYRTRAGGLVTNLERVQCADYPWLGRINGALESWTAEGSYLPAGLSAKDLVEEVAMHTAVDPPADVALADACRGLLGLLQLIANRDDVSDDLRTVLATNHRVKNAEALLEILGAP